MYLKKIMATLVLVITLTLTQSLAFSAEEPAGGMMDDSLKDISVVLGSGAVGAVLGLSTLSFVNTPSNHLKNISIGGAIGIVVGVGVVIFGQATRASSSIGQNEIPMNSEKFESLSKQDFTEYKIAKNSDKIPSFDFHFSF